MNTQELYARVKQIAQIVRAHPAFPLMGFPVLYWAPRILLVAGFGVWLATRFWATRNTQV